MKLRYIEIQGFRSFKNKTRIEFPESGLVLVRGKSGVGKSNLFLAIAYALDICPVPATKLKGWGSGSMQVELGLEDSSGPIVIRRGKENSIVSPSGEVTGAKAVTEALPQLMGLAAGTLSAVTYRVQRSPGTFLSKGDGDKKEFLGALIPLLAEIERVVEESETKLKELNAQKTPLALKIEGLRANGVQLSAAQGLQQPDTEWETKKPGLVLQVEEITKQISETRISLSALQEQTKARLAGLESDAEVIELRSRVSQKTSQLQEVSAANAKKRAEFEHSQVHVRSQVAELKKALWTSQAEISKESSYRQKLGLLEQNRCPTCEQPWDKSQDTKISLLENLEKIEKLKKNAPAIQGVISKMEAGIANWVDDPLLAPLREELEQSKTELSQVLSKKRTEISDLGADTRRELEISLAQKQSELQNLDFQIRTGDASHQEKIGVRVKMQKMLDDNQSQIAKLETQLESLTKESAMEEQILKILGKTGFLGSIFDQILLEIEKEVNDMLLQMSNSQSISIRFKTESTTQKGVVKKTIVPTVYIDGNETDLATGPSGGQQSAIELIADLAVLRVVERRTGRTPGWLLQDEVIIGQGAETSMNALEILRSFAEDKLVLVIDHSSEVKELFQKVIDISMENGVSIVS